MRTEPGILDNDAALLRDRNIHQDLIRRPVSEVSTKDHDRARQDTNCAEGMLGLVP